MKHGNKTKDKQSDKETEKQKGKKKHELSDEEYQKLISASEELEQTKDKLLRTIAEFENTKKRLEKQKLEFVQYANKKIFTELLPSIENLDRAVQTAKTDHSVESLIQGVEMIFKQLTEVLKGNGVEKVNSVGKPFDPHIHEAVGTVETDEYDDNVVVEEISPGYRFKEHLLKPAMVRVSVKPSKAEDQTQEKPEG